MITKEWISELPKHGRYEMVVRYTVHRSIWKDLHTGQRIYIDAKLHRKRLREAKEQMSLFPSTASPSPRSA